MECDLYWIKVISYSFNALLLLWMIAMYIRFRKLMRRMGAELERLKIEEAELQHTRDELLSEDRSEE